MHDHEPVSYLDRLARLHRELGISPGYAGERNLAAHVEAREEELVQIGLNDEGRPIRLTRDAAEAWASMRNAATVDGITLLPVSGFRSVARQVEIIEGKLAAGNHLDAILRYVAAPGFSEHHTGRALDIGSPDHIELDEEFARTSAFRWLERRAAEFGFRMSYPPGNSNGIGYEPWHWCWTPAAFTPPSRPSAAP